VGAGDRLLGYVSPSAAQRMLAAGHVVGRGTKNRIRVLISVHDNVDLYLLPGRPPTGQHYSHKHETPDNPRGVWTLRKLTGSRSGR